MAPKQRVALFLFTLISSTVGTLASLQPPGTRTSFSNFTSLTNLTGNVTKSTVSAPYFRNVSAGDAWVVPSSAFDLGARYVNCECFDPSRKLLLALLSQRCSRYVTRANVVEHREMLHARVKEHRSVLRPNERHMLRRHFLYSG